MTGTNVYKIKNKKPTLSGYIKSDEEINKETAGKIRERYSLDDEFKILRCASIDKVAFKAYNDYVEQCRTEGIEKKTAAAAKRETLKKKNITENGKTRVIYVNS